MEKEQNKAILKKALLALPSYHPPEDLWHGIEKELGKDSNQDLSSALANLPSYRPPTQIWEGIQGALEQESLQETKTKLIQFPIRRGWLIAASIALLLTASWIIYSAINMGSAEKVSYASSTIEVVPYDINFQEDEPMIIQVSDAFERSPLAQSQSNYQSLMDNLNELNMAKSAILEMMQNYGEEDPQMIKELADIERSRTDIVMKMARFI